MKSVIFTSAILFVNYIVVYAEPTREGRDLVIVRSDSVEIKKPKLNHKTELKFSDFLKKAIIIFKSYDDDDLENLLTNVHNELKKYSDHELIKNTNTKAPYQRLLEMMSQSSVTSVRSYLDALLGTLRHKKTNQKVKKLAHFINSIYRNDSKQFLVILTDLDQYRYKSKRANVDLANLIRNGLKRHIFDRYNSLDTKNKLDLELEMDSFITGSNEKSHEKPSSTRKKHRRQGEGLWTLFDWLGKELAGQVGKNLRHQPSKSEDKLVQSHSFQNEFDGTSGSSVSSDSSGSEDRVDKSTKAQYFKANNRDDKKSIGKLLGRIQNFKHDESEDNDDNDFQAYQKIWFDRYEKYKKDRRNRRNRKSKKGKRGSHFLFH